LNKETFMQWKHVPSTLMVAISLAGFFFVVQTARANEGKSTNSDQQQMRDNTTTKSKLESRKKSEGDADFKELNKHAPGGAEAAPDVKGHNKSSGTGTGTGSGTGTTGASGGSGTGGSGSGGN
jgi:hypothetical protein